MKEHFRLPENITNELDLADIIHLPILLREYDKEIFDLASTTLTQEFEQANPEVRKQILIDRFVDSAQFFLRGTSNRSSKETKLFARFGMRPMPMDFHSMADLRLILNDEYRVVLYGEKRNRYSLNSEGVIYGPTRVYHVAPNELIKVSLGDQDIISTVALSSCSALVLQENDSCTMAHFTESLNLFMAGQALIKTAQKSGGVVTFVSPEFTEIPGNIESTRFVAMQNGLRDKVFEEIGDEAKKAGVELRVGGYPYVSNVTYRDPRIFETAVVVGNNFCSSIGYKEVNRDGGGREPVFVSDTTRSVFG